VTLWPDDLGGAGQSAAHHDPPQPAGHDPLAELLGPVGATPSSWTVGAAGERHTAALLTSLAARGWTVLHDRRLPGQRANLDHLAIGPPGVVLIDSKQFRGRIKLLGGRLWYGPRDLQTVFDLVNWEATECAHRLGAEVMPMLCIHGAHLPTPVMRWHGIRIAEPGRLTAVLDAMAAVLDPLDVIGLAARADRLLPPASCTP
jgi:hypothetical protein